MSLAYARNAGTLTAMGGFVNLRSIIQEYAYPGSNAGVSALNDLTSSIDLISSDGSIIIDKSGGTGYDSSGNAIDASGNRVLNLRVADASGNGVASLQGLTGAVNIYSPTNTLTFGVKDQEIELDVVFPAPAGVLSLASLTGDLTFSTSDQSAVVAIVGTDTIDIKSNATMSWDFEGTGIGHTTTLVLPAPYQWTINYKHIWTMTATIPGNWVARANTFISLFIWNIFSTSTATFNHFTYELNGGGELPLGKTSTTRYFTNSGLNQLIPITGNLVGIPLAPADLVVIRLYGRVTTGTHTMTNIDGSETAWGVFSATF